LYWQCVCYSVCPDERYVVFCMYWVLIECMCYFVCTDNVFVILYVLTTCLLFCIHWWTVCVILCVVTKCLCYSVCSDQMFVLFCGQCIQNNTYIQLVLSTYRIPHTVHQGIQNNKHIVSTITQTFGHYTQNNTNI
jgi:Na+/melibiose symporter-like transporter